MTTGPLRLVRLGGLVLTLLAGALAAHAQTTFTLTATASASGVPYGYTNGQSYTFVFTTGASFQSASNLIGWSGNGIIWNEQTLEDDWLFTSVTGTGVTGTLERDPSDPSARIYISPGNGATQRLALSTGANGDGFSGNSVGLFTPGGSPLQLNAQVALPTTFTVPGSADIEPNDYFSAYLGDYGDLFPSDSYISIGHPEYGDLFGFTVTGLTISNGSAIPEPSAYALLAGLATLGLAAARRRRPDRA